jgi:hypothetical protein
MILRHLIAATFIPIPYTFDLNLHLSECHYIIFYEKFWHNNAEIGPEGDGVVEILIKYEMGEVCLECYIKYKIDMTF